MQKNHDFKKIALLGIASGLLVVNCSTLDAASKDSPSTKDSSSTSKSKDSKDSKDSSDDNENTTPYHLMTEEELLSELNAEGKALYQNLSPEGKELARDVASMRCQYSNKCKGLNACATDKNTCAGKGSCKGQGKCAIADKNLAVKLVSQKMGAKRASMAPSKESR